MAGDGLVLMELGLPVNVFVIEVMRLDTAWVESLMNAVALDIAFSATAAPVTLIDPRADVTKSLAVVIAELTEL